jgi:RND family efflux transporter MFP subunit
MNVTDTAVKSPPAPGEAAANSTAKLRKAGLVALFLMLIGALAGLLPRWHQRAVLRDETQDLAESTVNVVSAIPGKTAAGLLLPAEVKAYLEAPIYARTSGYLQRWLVDIGAQVKEGDLLAEIDTPEMNQELAQVRSQLVQAQAALELAKTTAARWAELLKTASVSEQEGAEKRADLELKQANVEAARANVRRLEDLQSFEQVKAPFAGTITARNTDVGQLISAAGGRELFRLAQTRTLRVYVRVPETAAHGVVAGQAAEVSVPEMPGRTFPAKVVRTAGAMAADSRTLLTELELDNPRGEILAGTYAQVRFTDARPDVALTLPSNTLLFRAEGPQIGVVKPDGKVELHDVTIGRDFGPTIEIISGIAPSDRVILNPPDSLVSGTTVRVANNSAKTLTDK